MKFKSDNVFQQSLEMILYFYVHLNLYNIPLINCCISVSVQNMSLSLMHSLRAHCKIMIMNKSI